MVLMEIKENTNSTTMKEQHSPSTYKANLSPNTPTIKDNENNVDSLDEPSFWQKVRASSRKTYLGRFLIFLKKFWRKKSNV